MREILLLQRVATVWERLFTQTQVSDVGFVVEEPVWPVQIPDLNTFRTNWISV